MSARLGKFAFVALAALLLAACEGTMGTKEQKPAPVATTSTASTSSTQGVSTSSGYQGNPLDNPNSLLAKRTVYFDFDSSAVHDQDRAIIEAHAHYLAEHPKAHVRLEGNCDERGTREYNLALGERRAKSVERLMTLLGANPQQITTISYGKERPAVQGHNEAAWRLNRRVDIVYTNRG